MQKKTKAEEEPQKSPQPIEEQLEETQKALMDEMNKTNLMEEMKSLEQDGYFRLQTMSYLMRIAQAMEKVPTLVEVISKIPLALNELNQALLVSSEGENEIPSKPTEEKMD